MSIRFEFMEHGDCTIITTKDFTMMIDGGYSAPFHPLTYFGSKPTIDTIIVTHIDRDHIGGIIEFLSYPENILGLKHIVFNEPNQQRAKLFTKVSKSSRTSISDGRTLSEALSNYQHINHHNLISTECEELKSEVTGATIFKVISPTPEKLIKLFNNWDKNKWDEAMLHSRPSSKVHQDSDTRPLHEMGDIEHSNDTSVPNGSSLAFLIEHMKYKFLILGDAHINQVTRQLERMGYCDEDGKRLRLDFVKLSHHGSKKSTSKAFLALIDCSTFVISKPSQNCTKKPDRDTIAKIAKHANPKNTLKSIYINIPSVGSLNFSQEEKKEYLFEIRSTSEYKFRYQ